MVYVWVMNGKTDALTFISYLIAASVVLPITWWLKEHIGLAEWMRSLFY